MCFKPEKMSIRALYVTFNEEVNKKVIEWNMLLIDFNGTYTFLGFLVFYKITRR